MFMYIDIYSYICVYVYAHYIFTGFYVLLHKDLHFFALAHMYIYAYTLAIYMSIDALICK